MAEEVREQEEMNYDPFANIDLSMFETDAIVNEEEVVNEELEKETDTPVEDTEAGDNTEEQEEDNGEKPSSQETKDSSPFTPFAKLLVEEGATPNLNLEEFDGTPQGLIKAIQQEIEYNTNMYKESLDPRVKWLQDNIDEGVAFEDLLAIDKQRMSLNFITEDTLSTDENVQKQIVKEYLKETTKFSDSLIDKQIERLEITGELTDEAKGYFEELKQINAAKEQQAVEQAKVRQQEFRQQQEKILNDFKETLEKTEEIIPGIKLNRNIKDQIFKTLTTPVTQDPNTGAPLNAIAKARLEDPINFEKNLAYVWLATKGFKDFSTLNSAGKKTAMKEFESALNKGDNKFSTSKQNFSEPDSIKELKASMERFSNMNI
ncbi:MAG: hypothetical protein WCS33_01445 [Candidatus Caldatribacteriota bacterium]